MSCIASLLQVISLVILLGYQLLLLTLCAHCDAINKCMKINLFILLLLHSSVVLAPGGLAPFILFYDYYDYD